jgi:hypothetical protein
MKNSRGVGCPISKSESKATPGEASKGMLQILQEAEANHFDGIATGDEFYF